MAKKLIVAIVGLIGLFATVFGVKAMQIRTLIDAAASMQMPPTVVSTTKVFEQEWLATLSSVGSLEAVQGVVVTADTPGRVESIHFTAGAQVKKGDVLVTQDTSTEQTQLRAAKASAELALADLKRVEELFKKKVVSKAEHDSADAAYKSAVAQVDNIRTTIQKKNIRAPFDGRLGIRQINVGQDLGTGEAIVSLQEVNPIFVNFFLPQQDLSKLKQGLKVKLTSNAVPGEEFEGEVTAIDSEVDLSTRSVRVQATLKNDQEKLMPGMFANVSVEMPTPNNVVAVPLTAVSYATYGDSVFVVSEKTDEQSGNTFLSVQQQFVRLGPSKGDYVSIEAGIKPGDEVVSGGVFKLRNGAPIAVNNKTALKYEIAPNPEDS
ncbi:MAG: efflux RND transporter periplasmic adaptor subunit [Cellvibrionaceae bacterium]|nr:efflux RND transporter periplasmic adaptor subunit [Cellvibrionaceae bacterium]